MLWIIAPFALLAVLCWLSAVVNWILSLGHLSGRTTVGQMLFKGIESFNAENFTERGRVYQKRYLHSVIGFVVCGVLLLVAGGLASAFHAK